MPELSNIQHERFCREYIKPGTSRPQAVRLAGYPDNGHDYAAKQGYRLMNIDEVRQRIDELKKQAFETEEITEDLLLKAMMNEITNAENSRDRREAIKVMMQTKGMLKDRHIHEDVAKQDIDIIAVISEVLGVEAGEKALLELGYDNTKH